MVCPAVSTFKFKHFGHDQVILHERDIRKEVEVLSVSAGALQRTKGPGNRRSPMSTENPQSLRQILRRGQLSGISVMVKRILNKYGYPPDLQEEAVKTVLAQAELLSAEWAEA